jgi:hypothetical protein
MSWLSDKNEGIGNYVGIVINTKDPEGRGRIQVFVPGITPRLYANWDAEFKDKSFKTLDPTNFPADVLERLKSLLPWSESAVPLWGGGSGAPVNTASTQATPIPTHQSFSAPSGRVATENGNAYIKDTPWSAAFISYVAGSASPSFPTSGAHVGYAQAVKNGNVSGWTALDPATTQLQPGDIIIKNRNGANNTFNSSNWDGTSHGDVVTNVNTDGSATVIGGNVSDTVSQRTITPNSNDFAVIRPTDPTVAQNVVNNAQQEYNTWSSNNWNEQSPGAFDTISKYYAAGNLAVPDGVGGAPAANQNPDNRVTETKNGIDNPAGEFDATQKPITAGNGSKQLNASALPAGLQPYAQDFQAAGDKYGIDPNFLAAISWNETGGGTSKAFLQGNNAMGISNASGPVYGFASVSDSIDQQARTLANPTGPYAGAQTIGQIGNIYSPIGAENDFYGTNSSWVPTVGSFYDKLTGNGNNATVLNNGGTVAPGGSNNQQNVFRTTSMPQQSYASVNGSRPGSAMGSFSQPQVGSKVWMFFEAQNTERPVYFAAVKEPSNQVT